MLFSSIIILYLKIYKYNKKLLNNQKNKLNWKKKKKKKKKKQDKISFFFYLFFDLRKNKIFYKKFYIINNF